MATKIYVTNSAPDKTLPTVQGTWDDSSASLTRFLGAKAGVAATAAATSAATNVNFLVGRWQSWPLLANTSFATSDTIQWVLGAVGSSTTNSTWVYRTHIFVIQSDGVTVRGTLFANVTGTTTFTTTATGRTDSAVALSNNVSALQGDRIVIELGYRRTGSNGGSRSCTYNYGNTGVTDLASGSTNVTTDPGFYQFSNTFSFDDGGPSPTINSLRMAIITARIG